MRRLILIGLLLALCGGVFAQVNGEVRMFDDKKVVRVWGSHQERGYALGYLMGDTMLEVFNDYILEYLMGGGAYYAMIRAMFQSQFTAEDIYMTELQAMLDGAVAAGYDLHNDILNRDVDVTDLLLVNAIIDLSAMTRNFDPTYFGCSTITSWGEATVDDPELGGELVMTRFMDWSSHQSLIANPVVIVHFPSEENEVAWASFTYPGLQGALSVVDETGRAVMLNMGNYHTVGTGTDLYQPQLLNVRMGVESYDFDEDGSHTLDDVVASITSYRRRCGTIVTAVAPPSEEAPRIIESNDMAGVSVRMLADNTSVQGNNIAATNHFRTLYDPVACSRYSAIVDSLADDPLMTLVRSPKMLGGAAGISNNLMAIRYDTQNQTVGVSFTGAGHYAYQGPYTELSHDDLFGDWTGVDDNEAPHSGMLELRAWPNPFNPTTTIAFTAAKTGHAAIEVYDIRGRHVDTVFNGVAQAGPNSVAWRPDGLASGVYLARVRTDSGEETAKLLLLE